MKIKILPLVFIISFFLIIFLIFYKGLNNSNIYTPETNLKVKNQPNNIGNIDDEWQIPL